MTENGINGGKRRDNQTRSNHHSQCRLDSALCSGALCFQQVQIFRIQGRTFLNPGMSPTCWRHIVEKHWWSDIFNCVLLIWVHVFFCWSMPLLFRSAGSTSVSKLTFSQDHSFLITSNTIKAIIIVTSIIAIILSKCCCFYVYLVMHTRVSAKSNDCLACQSDFTAKAVFLMHRPRSDPPNVHHGQFSLDGGGRGKTASHCCCWRALNLF